MMNIKFYLSVLFAASLFTIASCSKEGPAGEDGATGPAGTAGAAGAAGAQGTQGATGTANVIYSPWLDVTFIPDTVRTGGTLDTLGYYSDITATKLDNAILTSGDMHVYLNANTSASPYIFPLPYLDIYSGLDITVAYQLQTISLYSNGDASTFTVSDGSKVLQYRYILVPGGVASGGRTAHPEWKDYQQVKAFYHISD